MSSSNQSGWTCASCHRRVPSHVTTCRCGSTRAAEALATTDAATPPAARVVNPFLVLALIGAVAVAIALPAWSRRAPAPAPPPPAPEAIARPVAATPPPEPPRPEPPPSPPPPEVKHEDPLEDVVARAVPAVATIQAGQTRGSGFFVRRDVVVTNAHVVDGQSVVKLQVGDRTYLARVANVSSGSDLAVLKLDQPSATQATLELGSATQARVGQEVIAIGSALGVLSNTVTRGIISAVRQVGPVTLLQTDAAINPGNSGGPLLDRNGVVIGVNSMAVAKQTGEGVAFAVAINHVTQLLDTGRPLASTQTPLNGLQQMFTGPSESDQERTHGERDLTQALTAAARAADQVDTFWNRYKSPCLITAYGRGSRPWFGVFMRDGVTVNERSTYDCNMWLQTVAGHAEEIKAAVEQATAAARKAGVFPGTVRDLLRQNHLDWEH
jgi:S1-C subfamily serine protease